MCMGKWSEYGIQIVYIRKYIVIFLKLFFVNLESHTHTHT